MRKLIVFLVSFLIASAAMLLFFRLYSNSEPEIFLSFLTGWISASALVISSQFIIDGAYSYFSREMKKRSDELTEHRKRTSRGRARMKKS